MTASLVPDAFAIPRPATPAAFASCMQSAPVLSTKTHDWRAVSIERYKVPSFAMDLAACGTHRLTLDLAGPVLIRRKRGGRHDCEWSQAGCSNFVPAGVPVVRSCEEEADFMVAYLDPRVVDEVATEVFGVDSGRIELAETLAARDPALERFGALLLAEAEADVVGTRLFLETLVRALAVHLLRVNCAHVGGREPFRETTVDWRVQRAIELMRARLDQELALAELSNAAGLSPSHFARAFRAATGLPPHRYLIRLRVQEACRLLERTGMPIIEVGLSCGFEQPTHFATMFRKVMGLAPRAYRTACRS